MHICDTERGKRNYWEGYVSQCQFVHHKNDGHGRTWDRNRATAVRKWRLTASGKARPLDIEMYIRTQFVPQSKHAPSKS